MRSCGSALVLAVLVCLGASACCAGSGDRKVTPTDATKAEDACRAKPRYSPALSASLMAELDRKIPLSERVEVYATLGKSSLAFTDL
jgi:hypothetical protein